MKFTRSSILRFKSSFFPETRNEVASLLDTFYQENFFPLSRRPSSPCYFCDMQNPVEMQGFSQVSYSSCENWKLFFFLCTQRIYFLGRYGDETSLSLAIFHYDFFFIKKYGWRRSISSVHSSSSTLRVIVGRTRLSILIYIYNTNQQGKKRIIIQRVTGNKARNVFNEKKRPPVFSLTL